MLSICPGILTGVIKAEVSACMVKGNHWLAWGDGWGRIAHLFFRTMDGKWITGAEGSAMVEYSGVSSATFYFFVIVCVHEAEYECISFAVNIVFVVARSQSIQTARVLIKGQGGRPNFRPWRGFTNYPINRYNYPKVMANSNFQGYSLCEVQVKHQGRPPFSCRA